ncbi:DNA polymerase III subunit beta [Moorellaceae bacterium AZ2]
MKVTCKVIDLKKAIHIAQKMLPRATTIPSLEGVFLDAGGGVLRITTHNLDWGGTLQIPAAVEKEGKILVPGKSFCALVETFLDGEISIETKEKTMLVQRDKSKIDLALLDLSAYPPFPEADNYVEIVAPAEEIRKAVRDTIDVPDSKSPYSYASSVLFEAEDRRLNLVATDTHRLVVSRVPGAQIAAGGRWLVPVTGLAHIPLEVEGEVAMRFSAGFVHFLVPRGVYYVRLAAAHFPPYKQVWPNEKPRVKIKADTGRLVQVLQRARLMVNEQKGISIINLAPHDSGLFIKTTGCEMGTIEELVPAEVEGEGFMVIHVNAGYLLSLVRRAGEKTVLKLYYPHRPIEINTEGDDRYRALVLPILVEAGSGRESEQCA